MLDNTITPLVGTEQLALFLVILRNFLSFDYVEEYKGFVYILIVLFAGPAFFTVILTLIFLAVSVALLRYIDMAVMSTMFYPVFATTYAYYIYDILFAKNEDYLETL